MIVEVLCLPGRIDPPVCGTLGKNEWHTCEKDKWKSVGATRETENPTCLLLE